MAIHLQNRIASLAGLALAAGLTGIAAAPAKGDVDWSFSINLGWCTPDPYCAPVVYPAPVVYSGWYGGGYCSPYYRPYYYRPYYGYGYGWGYYNNYYNPYGYYISAPVYAYSSPLYLHTGTTYYSRCSGTTSITTFYSPYVDYYRPAYLGGGFSFSYSNWDNDCDDWRRRDCDDRHDHHDRRDRDNWDRSRNNPQPLPAMATDPYRDRTSRGPMANQFPTGSNGKPAVGGDEAPGVLGPPAVQPVGAKGPRPVSPVAVKPVESKPVTAKPTLPVLTQSKPTNPRQTGAISEAYPTGPTTKPSTITEKPTQGASKPIAPLATSKPTVRTPSEGKPTLPTANTPNKAPVVTTDKAPSRGQPLPSMQTSKPTQPRESPSARPTAPTREKPVYTPPQRNTPSLPSAQPSRGERAPSKAPSMPSAKPSAPQNFAPSQAPRASAPSQPRASAPAPRASAPAPRASAPAPSAPRQSAPSPSSKPSGDGGGKRR